MAYVSKSLKRQSHDSFCDGTIHKGKFKLQNIQAHWYANQMLEHFHNDCIEDFRDKDENYRIKSIGINKMLEYFKG